MSLKVKNMIPEDDPRVAPIGHPAPPWMVNYADLMTELVCFFVILYALSAALNKNVQNASQEIKEMMAKGEITGKVEVNKEGLKITLEEQGSLPFFESGKAEMTVAMEDKIDKLYPTLEKLSKENEIIVEGHTDDIPIATKEFPSNWELSTARATNVVRRMIEKGFSPRRISAVGYGQYRPIVLNNSLDNRRKNRRVVFFVKLDSSKVLKYDKNKK